jgi:hypothetical protein
MHLGLHFAGAFAAGNRNLLAIVTYWPFLQVTMAGWYDKPSNTFNNISLTSNAFCAGIVQLVRLQMPDLLCGLVARQSSIVPGYLCCSCFLPSVASGEGELILHFERH